MPVRQLAKRILSEQQQQDLSRGVTGLGDRVGGCLPQPVRRALRNRAARRMIRLASSGPQAAEAVRLRAYARWWLKGIALGSVEEVHREGFALSLHLSDNLQRCLFYTGTYETEFLRFLESEVQAGDVYIDVGGHIGLDALVVARRLEALGGGHAYVFEPLAESAAKIRQHAERNGLAHIVEVTQCGLADEEGTLALRADPEWDAADVSVLSRYNAGRVVAEAPLHRFDTWAANAGLDSMAVVKLDVEGCELDALRGMAGSLRRLRPRSVVVELGAHRLDQASSTAGDIDELLAGCGYARSGEEFLENVVYRPRLAAHQARTA